MLRQIILFFLGIVFLMLGVIGLLIPVIPQVPFFIAALLCFCGCIPGLRKWLASTTIYQRYLLSHIQKHKFLRDLMEE